MDFITVVSLTIFVATVGTIVMALVSYGAFKVREWRRPRARPPVQVPEPSRAPIGEFLFFKKYVPPPEEPLERET
jgi:hypothetical protein